MPKHIELMQEALLLLQQINTGDFKSEPTLFKLFSAKRDLEDAIGEERSVRRK